MRINDKLYSLSSLMLLCACERSPRYFSSCLHFPPYTQTLLQETQGQNKRFWGINPNFKSSAFRPAGITKPNLYALPPAFSQFLHFTLCFLSFSLHPTSLLSFSLLISFCSCFPPSLRHNSLSHYNSLDSINPFSAYFIAPSLR